MRWFLATAAAVALLAGGLSPPAQATLQLSASVNGTTVLQCSDNQVASLGCPGGDQNPAIGTLDVPNGTFLGVTINGSIQTSQGTLLTPNALDILNSSALSITNTNGANANILAAVSDTNFVGPISSYDVSTSGVFQTAIGSSITTAFFDDPTNVQGADSPFDAPGTQLATFSKTATLLADSYSFNNSGAIVDPALFSMTQTINATLVPGAVLVNRGSTEIKTPVGVSEPGTLAILGVGLIGTGFALSRRRRKARSDNGRYAIA